MSEHFVTYVSGLYTTPQSITEEIFPTEPVLDNQAPVYRVARALEQVWELSPDGRLLYMIVHDAKSENRFMECYVQQPGLLAWSENYRFDTEGNYLDTAGYTRVMHGAMYSRIAFISGILVASSPSCLCCAGPVADRGLRHRHQYLA